MIDRLSVEPQTYIDRQYAVVCGNQEHIYDVRRWNGECPTCAAGNPTPIEKFFGVGNDKGARCERAPEAKEVE